MATERMQLLLQAQTLGVEEVAKLQSAVERLTASTDKTRKGAESLNNTRFDKFAESVRSFIQNPLDAAGGAVEGLFKKLGPLGAGAGVAAAGIGVLAKVGYDAAKQLGELADQTGTLALATGLTNKQVGEFSFAFKRAGGDISSFMPMLRALSQALSEGGTEGKAQRDALRELGVSAKDTEGRLRPTADVVLDLTQKLAAMPNVWERNRLATKVFGESVLNVIDDVLDLSAGVERARKLGIAPSDAELNRWAQYQTEIAEAGQIWERLQQKLKDPIAATVVVAVRWAFNDKGFTGTRDKQGGLLDQGLADGFNGDFLNFPSQVLAGAAVNRVKGLFQPFQFGRDVNGFETFSPLSTPSPSLPNAPGLPNIAGALNTYRAQANLRVQILSEQRRSEAGLRSLLSESEKTLSSASTAYFNYAGSDAGEAAQLRKAWQDAEAAVRGYKAQLESVTRKPDVLKIDTESLGQPIGTYRSAPSLVRARGASGTRYSTITDQALVISQADITAANAGANEASRSQTLGFLNGLTNRGLQDEQRRERIAATTLEHQARMVELLAGPGGEVAAIQQITALRLQAAKTQEEATRIEYEYTERIASLRQQQVREWRDTLGSTFDALTGGGAGVRGFVSGYARSIGRTAFQNFGSSILSPGRFTLPGQGTAENPTFLGKLLQGTPLGLDPLKAATDQNTVATIENTAAIRTLASGGVGGGGGTAAAISTGFRGVSGISGILSGGGTSLVAEDEELASILATSNRPRISGLTRGIGYAGAALGGAASLYSGITTGGARGVLTAGAGLSGSVGAILGLAGVAGPAAPILAGVGLGLGLITTLFGDPKQKRAEYLDSEAQRRSFTDPTGANYAYAFGGYGVDYAFDGRMRPVIVNNYISAVDSQSFAEAVERNGVAVTQVITKTVSDGNGDDLLGTVRQALAI